MVKQKLASQKGILDTTITIKYGDDKVVLVSPAQTIQIFINYPCEGNVIDLRRRRI